MHGCGMKVRDETNLEQVETIQAGGVYVRVPLFYSLSLCVFEIFHDTKFKQRKKEKDISVICSFLS
jgi:hypothetical protein